MKYIKVAVPDDFDPKTNKLVVHDNASLTDQEDVCPIWEPQYRDVLDHGFIGLVDFMGDDQCIVDAARVSYGQGTRRLSEDRNLIRYLIRNRHWTPVEMVEIKWHVKAPIFVFRQWHRHRTASINEYSARYSVMCNDMYMPDASVMKPQSATNKQGRSGTLSENNIAACQLQLQNIFAQAAQAYAYLLGATNTPDDSLNHRFLLIKEEAMKKVEWLQKTNPDWLPERVTDVMIDAKINEVCEASGMCFTDQNFWGEESSGLSRELARIAMPLATYSEMYWKCDLRNTFNFVSLRSDAHAQEEVRIYSDAMLEMMEPIAPVAVAAFMDYQMQGRQLSKMELDAVRYFYRTMCVADPAADTTNHDIENIMTEAGAGKREINEFLNYLTN